MGTGRRGQEYWLQPKVQDIMVGSSKTTLRRRSTTPTIVPSFSESSFSDYEDEQPSNSRPKPDKRDTDKSTVHKIFNSTFFLKRLSSASSLPWGHKPHPLIGASCFLFLLPIPFMLRACCPVAAFFLGCVTVSSYLSDHVYTGLDSWTHTLDRVLAPTAFSTCCYAVYSMYGVAWAASSLVAVKCHLLGHYYSKNGMYDQFVIWHSLWHAVGVGLIVACFTVNGVVGKCWERSEWEDVLHERFMMF